MGELAGRKVGITAAGSGSDLLARWTMQDRKVDFTRTPGGGGGLVPNLRSRNLDALAQPRRGSDLLAADVPADARHPGPQPDRLHRRDAAPLRRGLDRA
jgi:hypothetical protein